MKILMCRPIYFGIKYEINPWMSLKHLVDHQKALQQWDNLYQTILNCGAQVELVPPQDGWPDMTFTANAGLFYKNRIILSHLKYKERQGETPFFQQWFEQAGMEVLNTPGERNEELYFEGAGDALLAGDYLFAGYGFRSDRRFFANSSYFDQDKLIYCELTDPYFYHLDTCFCPLNEQLAIWYPPAFTLDSQKNMAKHIELIPVAPSEAKHFASNSVVIDNHVILPSHCPQIADELQKRGFTVHHCEMDEFLKSGGACKCLTLRLD